MRGWNVTIVSTFQGQMLAGLQIRRALNRSFTREVVHLPVLRLK